MGSHWYAPRVIMGILVLIIGLRIVSRISRMMRNTPFEPAPTVGLTTTSPVSGRSATAAGSSQNSDGTVATPPAARSIRYRLSVFHSITSTGFHRRVSPATRRAHSRKSSRRAW